MTDKQIKITRKGIVDVGSPPELAITLFTAEGEKLWLGDCGWNPTYIRGDGFHKNDVFIVGEQIFVTTLYDPKAAKAEYVRLNPNNSITVIKVKLQKHDCGSRAYIDYEMTALSTEGEKSLQQNTEAAFNKQMENWQTRICQYKQNIDKWIYSDMKY